MGNCMMGANKILAVQDDHKKQEPPLKALGIKATASQVANKDDGKKKMPRFKLGAYNTSDKRESGGGGNGGDTRSGVVRIRVIVTQRELHQLLNYTKGWNNFSSNKEQLVSALKLRGRRVSEIRASDGGIINCRWRPALDSIPENHS